MAAAHPVPAAAECDASAREWRHKQLNVAAAPRPRPSPQFRPCGGDEVRGQAGGGGARDARWPLGKDDSTSTSGDAAGISV